MNTAFEAENPRVPLMASSLGVGAAKKGSVYLVGGGPGDPGLLTLRAADLIASADVVLHDELIHPALLDLARKGAAVRTVGKRGANCPGKEAKQREIEAELVALAKAGLSVVRLKGGDPFLFGRGSEEACALAEAGIPFEVVPGVCSPLGAAAYAGISLTHRDLASSVTFVSATGRDGKLFDFGELSRVSGTICILMGMHNLSRVCEALMSEAHKDPQMPVAIIEWGTRAEQRVITAPLHAAAAKAHEKKMGSPAVIVLGKVVSLRESIAWFDRRPLFGKRMLVTRPRDQAGALASLIRRRGAEALIWPAIEIHEAPDPARVEQALLSLDRYEAVVFTSENGVRRFLGALFEKGLDARAFGRARLAAIGPGTASALSLYGLKADIAPLSDFRGEALADAILEDGPLQKRLAREDLPPPRVLIPRAKVARDVLPDRLRAKGLDVDIVPVYETRMPSPEHQQSLRKWLDEKRVDVILLTSGSTADSVCDALGSQLADLERRVLVASIGPVTTQAAERRGLGVGVTASVSTTSGLIDAVEKFFEAPDRARAPQLMNEMNENEKAGPPNF